LGFRFGLETVLKHRKRLEDVAQREFLEAQRALNECLGRIDSMYKRMDEVRMEIHQAQANGNRQALNEILESELFINGQKIRVQAERLKARQLMQIVEQKQEALILASREKKILVQLKDKKLVEYKEWLARIEAKALDDLTTTRFGWGNL
jgi:flagellar FliJ protein